jgi:2-hydroxymuconate-semialdehyde hydrolase
MPPRNNFQQVLSLIDPPAEHRFLDADGIRTSYLEAGTGPVLVLLHGAGGGAANWYKVIGPLSKYFRIIAFDKPGYGESDKPCANYSKAFYVNWLQAAVKALGISHFHLLGNSQGGAVAMAYALQYPEQVDQLVLVSPGGMSDDWDPSIIPQMILYRLFPSPIWDRLMGSKVFKDSTVAHPAWHAYTTEVIRKPGGRYPFFLGRGKAVQTFTDEELQAVRPPTLIIWGEEEAFFPIAHGERAAALIPDAKLVLLPNAGHFPWMEEPDRFVEAVVGFCDGPAG